MTILGIDLGTTNSLACVYRNQESVIITNNMQEMLTPSVVSIEQDGSIIVGRLAKERIITHPDRTVSNFKRYMGTNKIFTIGKYKFSPEELSSFVLRKLIEDAQSFLNEDIDEIVVSVPAYFNDDQRWATKKAGELAGVKIERIVNEPSAAALNLHQNYQEDRSYVVIDFGGGTLDVSVVDAFDNIIEIISVAGDNHLGGEDFNHIIASEFLKVHQLKEENLCVKDKEILYRRAEECKHMFNDQDEVLMSVNIEGVDRTFLFTYEMFCHASHQLMMRLEVQLQRALKDAREKISQIDDIVLVGGSCKMRLVKEYVAQLLHTEIKIESDPDLAIAYGCGVVAGIKERNEDIRDVLLSDICPFTLGIEINNGVFSPIIERNSILPCSRENTYQTIRLGQTAIDVAVYQGESLKVKDNTKLSMITIKVPKNKVEHEACVVRFTYDINGLLDIDITCLSTKEQWHELVIGKRNQMNKQQIKNRLVELSKLKMHPRDKEQNIYIVERANRMFMETLGMQRQMIQGWHDAFETALQTQDDRIIKDAYEVFKTHLDQLEYQTPSSSSTEYLL